MEIVRLEDVCTTTTSNLTLKELDKNNGAYPVYGASGLIKYIDFYNQDKEYIGIVKDGAGIGRVMLLPKNSSILGTMQYIFPNENIDIKYLYFNLIKMNLKKYYSGSTIPHIYFKDYKKEKIKLYSFEKQKKIAKILENISNIIEKKKQKLQEYELLSKCLFIKMFKENYDKKNWENFSLEEIVEICSSKRVFLDQIVMEGIDFYRGTEIGLLSEGKKIEPKLFITKEHYENLIAETGKPKIGDLLLPSICNDGKIWYVNTEKPFYFKDGRVLWIKESDKVKGKFLQYFLRNEFLMNYKKIASGTTFSELKIFSLKKMKVKLPPIELQNQFAERVKMIEKSKFLLLNFLKIQDLRIFKVEL